MRLLKSLLLITVLAGGGFGYYLLQGNNRPVENIIANGSCQNLETTTPVSLLKDQVYITAIHEDRYEGVVRSTGEPVVCPKTVATFIFGTKDHWPKFLREPEPELIEMKTLQVSTNPISDLKNKNILISGTCLLKGEKKILNQEPAAVLDTERIKGKYFIHAFVYSTSEKILCDNSEVATFEATNDQIEAAKLKVLKPEELIGKTILLTGICRIEGGVSGLFFNLIGAKAKVIEVEIRNGEPFILRAGIESKRRIVACGGASGKFVIEPYISLDDEK